MILKIVLVAAHAVSGFGLPGIDDMGLPSNARFCGLEDLENSFGSLS